ncbi:ATPase, T2SS/T4P/T4SS family [Aquincola sp. MAHUQ-54]|uniref:ATPase, T2SS/T4P/T4SS family n=1 Tax=Aquincola agrisoli TaxID=3119538 RepID=A0AAW9Q1X7_9BURK
MSDLSMPPLEFSMQDTVPAALDPDRAPAYEPFKWPTPPFASYPEPVRQSRPEDCDIEGLSGKGRPAKLMSLTPEAGIAHVKVLPARAAIPLRFDQFRRITLKAPLAPFVASQYEPHAAIVDHRPAVPFRLVYNDDTACDGETIGHVEAPYGVFLFEPADDRGSVRRSFVPREAYRHIEFGPRIGEILVEQNAATPQAIEQAVEEQTRLRAQKLGDILVTRQIVTPDQLLEAIDQQAKMPMVRIGEALTALGLITDLQLEEALEQQKHDRSVPLGELLVRKGLVSRQDLQTALARKMGYPVVDLAHFPVESEAVRKLPFPVADRLNTLPLLLRGARLIVALEDPSRRAMLEELEFVTQLKIVPTLATASQIARALPLVYERFGMASAGARGMDDPGAAIEFDAQDASKLVESLEQQHSNAVNEADDEQPLEQSDNSLVRLINTMIIDAHGQGVSDIHIETYPGREKLKIRFRKDGVLRPYLELPHTYRAALIARIKIMCDLDISERRKPQDGKINFAKFSPQHRLELRVATIPTNNSLEDVVMRLLASAKPLPLEKLGVSERNYKRLIEAVERPYGMVLCVGPTGSGKTTTLHSALAKINTPERKIWTAEDPVEITQAGLRQVQVNAKIDWTFAKALRAFLRADPDVIMVGEIRDGETAQMAVEASLTGHLVFSTLHTNSAPETVTRLLDMGMDPFNFADALLAVLAQRLVRRICAHCRVAQPATDAQVQELLHDYQHVFPPNDPRFDQEMSDETLLAGWTARFGSGGRLMHYHAPGCKHCDDSGFKGRVGLHELLSMSRDLRRLVQTGARVEEILNTALAEGMRTLRQDGIEKVLQGLTTIEEVRATSNV